MVHVAVTGVHISRGRASTVAHLSGRSSGGRGGLPTGMTAKSASPMSAAASTTQATAASPPSILRFVVFQIFATLDAPPPILVVAIPLDRGPDRLLEAVLRLPAQFAFDLGRVDRVAAV